MAETGGAENRGESGAGSWPGLLSELTKSFLILRDVFGYALPGAMFLVIGVVWKSSFLLELNARLEPYHFPVWILAAVGLGACYTIGHVMAGIAYFPFNTWGLPYHKSFDPLRWLAEKGTASGGKEHFANLLAVRARHPELFTEMDRQSIMTQLRGSTGVAMVAGWFLFCKPSGLAGGWLVGAAGIFFLITFWISANPHMANLRNDTIDAAKELDKTVKTIEPAQLKKILKELIDAAQAAHDKLV